MTMHLVLLPGMDGTGLLFDPFINIAKNHSIDIIAYSPDQKQSYSELIHDVRQKLPKDKAFIIIAESFSGPIAYTLMQDNITNLKGVIFVASFLSNPRPALLNFLTLLPLSLILKSPIPDRLIRYFFLGQEASKDQIKAFKNSLSKVDTKILASRIRQITNLNLEPQKVSCESAYIIADEDKLVQTHSVDVFKSLLPDITIKILHGPHFLMQTRAKQCLDVLEEMISLWTKGN